MQVPQNTKGVKKIFNLFQGQERFGNSIFHLDFYEQDHPNFIGKREKFNVSGNSCDNHNLTSIV